MEADSQENMTEWIKIDTDHFEQLWIEKKSNFSWKKVSFLYILLQCLQNMDSFRFSLSPDHNGSNEYNQGHVCFIIGFSYACAFNYWKFRIIERFIQTQSWLYSNESWQPGEDDWMNENWYRSLWTAVNWEEVKFQLKKSLFRS